jgi:hypothetical protein
LSFFGYASMGLASFVNCILLKPVAFSPIIFEVQF